MRKTIYAKMTALPVGLCALAFAVTSCGSSEYKKFADNEGKQVASILRENDCLACHSENAPLPFYGNLPLIGPVVQADMKEAVHYVDLTAMVEALENGQPVSEVDLAKVENTALSGSMPPAKYSHMPMHWGTSLDDNEKAVIISWAKNVRKDRFTTETVAEEFKNEPLQPLMKSLPTDPAKVELGFALYHDTRLSADNTISCATCHGLNTGGVDRKQYSEGINGQFGGVNAPTVYNAALNFVQFWDGRAADLKEQAAGPPLNPVEMGCTSFDQICEALAQDKDFTKKFTEVYPEGYSNIFARCCNLRFLLKPTQHQQWRSTILPAFHPMQYESVGPQTFAVYHFLSSHFPPSYHFFQFCQTLGDLHFQLMQVSKDLRGRGILHRHILGLFVLIDG